MKRVRDILKIFAISILAISPLLWLSQKREEPLDPIRADLVMRATPLPVVPTSGGGRFVVTNQISPDLKWIARDELGVPAKKSNGEPNFELHLRRWPDGALIKNLGAQQAQCQTKWASNSRTLYCWGGDKIARFDIAANGQIKTSEVTRRTRENENGAFSYPNGRNFWLFPDAGQAVEIVFRVGTGFEFRVTNLDSGVTSTTPIQNAAARKFNAAKQRFSCAVAPISGSKTLIGALLLHEIHESRVVVFDLKSGKTFWEKGFDPFSDKSRIYFSTDAKTLVLTGTPRESVFQNRVVSTNAGFDFLDIQNGETVFQGQHSLEKWHDDSQNPFYNDGISDVLYLSDHNQLRFVRVPNGTELPRIQDVNSTDFRGNWRLDIDFVKPHGDGRVWIFDGSKGVFPVRREDLGKLKKRWFELP